MSPAVRLPPVLLVAVLLHTAVFPHLRLFDVGPDVLLLLGIAAGIAAGPDRGAVVGFVAGLLADCFLQTPFGLSALVGCLVGWAVGTFQTRILHATWWIPPVTAAIASAAGTVAFAALAAVLGEDQLWSWAVARIAGMVALYAAVLTPLVTRLLRWSFLEESRAGLVLR